jgi:hypothetical protein
VLGEQRENLALALAELIAGLMQSRPPAAPVADDAARTGLRE